MLRMLKKVRGLLRRDRGCRGFLVVLVVHVGGLSVHGGCDGGYCSKFGVRAGDDSRVSVMRGSFS